VVPSLLQPLEHELLDLAERQREAVMKPYARGDDLDRVPVTPYDSDAFATDGPSHLTNPEIISPGSQCDITFPSCPDRCNRPIC
jgi:hypothetical protein